jgi:NADH-quinone oxidoreductase subunit N
MTPQPLPDWIPAYAEIFMLVAVSIILLIDLFLPERRRYVTYVLAQLTLLVAALLTIGSFNLAGGAAAYTFSGMFVADQMSVVLKLLTYLAVAVCFVYSRVYLEQRDMFRGEYFVLMLFGTLGMMVMISANHFLTLYLGLELMSLCLYALICLNRDSAQSTEAAMKYFVLGALASGLLLYGMSMIYGATGSLELKAISATLQAGGGERTILVFGLVFLVAGLAFKLGVVPFHMWIPDVYHGAPNAMTLFIGSAPKIAAFAMAMRLLVNGLLPLAVDWQQMLMIMAVLSLAIGNLAAIAQTNIKRMLAYSTISHMGFVLLGLLAGVMQTPLPIGADAGSADAIAQLIETNAPSIRDAYSASMFYVAVYTLMALGGFGIVLLLSRAGFEADKLDDLRGLNQRHPWYAFMMLIVMFSMAGIPPTVGFYAKLSVLQAVVQAGHVWLAVVAVLFSLIGAFYYLRVVKLMYFDDAVDRVAVRAPFDMRVLLSANALALLVLGIMPSGLMELCVAAIQSLVI